MSCLSLNVYDHLFEVSPQRADRVAKPYEGQCRPAPIFRRFGGGSGMVNTLVTDLRLLRMAARGSQFGKLAHRKKKLIEKKKYRFFASLGHFDNFVFHMKI